MTYKFNKNISKNNIFPSTTIALFFIIFTFIGFTGNFQNYFSFFLFLLWLVVAYLEDSSSFKNIINSPALIFFVFFLLYYFLTGLFFGSIFYLLKYVGSFLLCYGTIAFYEYYKNREDLTFIINVVFLSVIVISLWAIIFYLKNPSAARLLASNFYAFDFIGIGGGYSLAFAATLLFVFILDLLLSKDVHRKSYIITGFIVLFIFLFLVIKTESTLTFMALILGTFVALVTHFLTPKRVSAQKVKIFSVKKVIVIVFLVIILIVVAFNYKSILNWIINFTSYRTDNLFFRRLKALTEQLNWALSGESGNINYFNERVETISVSLRTFLKNPLLGVGHKVGYVFGLYSRVNIGTHSEWVDYFAIYGFVGGFPLLMVYLTSLNNLKKREYISRYSFIVSLVFMCLVNPFQTFQSCLTLFFLLPGLSKILYEKKITYTNSKIILEENLGKAHNDD